MCLELRHWGLVAYPETYAAMQAFTQARIDAVAPRVSTVSQEASNATENLSEIDRKPLSNLRNQLWICEHPAVYTQGLAGKAEHVLLPANIPVVPTNRGGQVTYHGPGQVVAYPLIDLKQAGYFVKEYVYRLEEAVLKTLAHFGVTGHRVAGSPGIYVRLDDPFSHAAWSGPAHPAEPFRGLGKIAALGIKISRHYTYHGLALNVAMDLAPFSRINPCGYANLVTTDLSTIGVAVSWQEAADVLSHKLGIYLAP